MFSVIESLPASIRAAVLRHLGEMQTAGVTGFLAGRTRLPIPVHTNIPITGPVSILGFTASARSSARTVRLLRL